MTIRRYAVLDADGFVVNTILIDEASAGKYWPGYGAKLLDVGLAPEEPKAPPPPPMPDDFGVLDVAVDLTEPLRSGDKVDFKTGEVIRKKDEPVADADPAVDPAVDLMPAELAKP